MLSSREQVVTRYGVIRYKRMEICTPQPNLVGNECYLVLLIFLFHAHFSPPTIFIDLQTKGSVR